MSAHDPHRERLRCLDGLRGVLATYVMLGHMAPFAWMPAGLVWVPGLVRHGRAAVDVFFMLSGLVIVRSLRRFDSRPGAFLAARFWRTYPVYACVLVLAVTVQTLPEPALPVWARPEAAGIAGGGWPDDAAARLGLHLAMAHGLLPDSVLPYACFAFLGSAWSLSTEWQFYFTAAAMRGARRSAWMLAWVFVAVGAAALAWQACAAGDWQFGRAFLPNKAIYFALGIAGAGLLEGAPGARRRYGVILAATLAMAVTDGDAMKLAAPLVWTACLGAELGVARPLAWGLTRRWPLRLGAISYCLYLVNEPVQRLLLLALPGAGPAIFDVVWLPGAIGLPLLGAMWLHDSVEQPALRLGRRRWRSAGVTAKAHPG